MWWVIKHGNTCEYCVDIKVAFYTIRKLKKYGYKVYLKREGV